jgi:colicin import membrane protein
VRERGDDTALAVLLALGLHVLLFALVVLGLWWNRAPPQVSAAGSPVHADIVDANALSSATQRALQAPKAEAPTPQPQPQPAPEPQPEQAPVPQQVKAQEPIPVPDQVEQEKVDRDALAADARAREQEEKHRQERIDLTEQREKQAEAEQKQKQLQQQLAEIKKQREKAAKEANLAEQKLQQIADARMRNAAQAAAQADASASAPPGNNGVDTGLLARYQAALQDAILRNWVRPDSVPLGQRCKLNIRQIPGGQVIDVQVAAGCPYDELGKRSVEAAVLKAQPLPYAGFEPVFQRNLTLNFEAQDR